MLATSVSNTILNAFFARGTDNPAIPTSGSCYIGVSTTTPTKGSSISGFTEPATSTGYRRSRLGLKDTPATYIMDAAANGSITNGTNFIFFDEATAGQGGFGTVTWFGLFSAASGGSPVLAGELTTPVTVNEGQVLIFRPNNLTVSME